MKTGTIEQRFRAFMLILAGLLCLGTIVELWLAEHTHDLVQLIPFVLCGLGSIAIVAALMRPRRRVLFALRLVAALLIGGSLFGMYEHVEQNLAFELEIRPAATFGDVWFDALRGASPLLAPGILALAGVLALASTYQHPVLVPRRVTQDGLLPSATSSITLRSNDS